MCFITVYRSLCISYVTDDDGMIFGLHFPISMKDNLAAMQTALRVLTAITEKHEPDTADIEELRRLTPSLAAMPPDELACGVIQQALKRRAELRGDSGSKPRAV